MWNDTIRKRKQRNVNQSIEIKLKWIALNKNCRKMNKNAELFREKRKNKDVHSRIKIESKKKQIKNKCRKSDILWSSLQRTLYKQFDTLSEYSFFSLVFVLSLFLHFPHFLFFLVDVGLSARRQQYTGKSFTHRKTYAFVIVFIHEIKAQNDYVNDVEKFTEISVRSVWHFCRFEFVIKLFRPPNKNVWKLLSTYLSVKWVFLLQQQPSHQFMPKKETMKRKFNLYKRMTK